MTVLFRCPNCAGLIHDSTAERCAFCGALLALTAPLVPPPALATSPSGSDSPGQALRALRDDPRWSEWALRQISVASVRSGIGSTLAAGLLITAFAVGFLVVVVRISGQTSTASPRSFLLPMAALRALAVLFALAFLIAAFSIVVRAVRGGIELASSPTQARPARVVARSTSDESASAADPRHLHGRVTLEFEDGSRNTYEMKGRTLWLLAEGDLGVAYTRGPHLLDFARA
jgi:hypothetical protein